jgi:hypothetical protein
LPREEEDGQRNLFFIAIITKNAFLPRKEWIRLLDNGEELLPQSSGPRQRRYKSNMLSQSRMPLSKDRPQRAQQFNFALEKLEIGIDKFLAIFLFKLPEIYRY